MELLHSGAEPDAALATGLLAAPPDMAKTAAWEQPGGLARTSTRRLPDVPPVSNDADRVRREVARIGLEGRTHRSFVLPTHHGVVPEPSTAKAYVPGRSRHAHPRIHMRHDCSGKWARPEPDC